MCQVASYLVHPVFVADLNVGFDAQFDGVNDLQYVATPRCERCAFLQVAPSNFAEQVLDCGLECVHVRQVVLHWHADVA